ncbi:MULTISPECIES: hypothetical protein [Pseudoalteromonas]|uniref:Uncharacterized protein n=1 Tax=Pseudoalteromonas aurantia 208 TaxID=1314867 RepID=A0ABR9EHK1_9GAMM|nr:MULTISPECIES: hypothetical protein [Pseudoalteromonas]MBE0370470.1 hypothetical protein [Pseudoalteromonas aurantia 208]MBQ4845084.1 hypothetical protein [Pseudoalteromonas sp. MMG005]
MTSRTYLYFHANNEFDAHAIETLIAQQHLVVLINPADNLSVQFTQLPQFKFNDTVQVELSNALSDFIDQRAEQSPLHVIHAVNNIDERAVTTDTAAGFAITRHLNQGFQAMKALADGFRVYGGNLVFLMQSDTLNYQHSATSSVCNHAQNAFMMTLAREYQGTGFTANSFVLPMMAADTKQAKKRKRELKGGVLGARPLVSSYQEITRYITDFVTTNSLLNGQCIAFTPCLEMKL